jgi:hypothetical protein
MNPFYRLRSPIRSNQFDVGVLTLARSFNGISERGGVRSQNNGTPTTGGEGQKAKEEDGPSWV